MNAETQIPTTVDLAASYEESGVRDVLRELDETLIGLAPVKKRIKEAFKVFDGLLRRMRHVVSRLDIVL